MASAELELQGAINVRLKADATLAEQVGGRVYDQPPDPVTYPYVTLGEAQKLTDDAECVSGAKIYLTLHAWSEEVGFPEVKRIAAAVEESLHMAPLELPTHRLVSVMHRTTRIFRDSNGLTSHAVIELLASVHKPLA